MSERRVSIIPSPKGNIKAIDLPFKIVKEDWNVYELEDGTVLRAKLVAVKISRGIDPQTGDTFYTDSGEPLYNIRHQLLITAEVPEKLLKSSRISEEGAVLESDIVCQEVETIQTNIPPHELTKPIGVSQIERSTYLPLRSLNTTPLNNISISETKETSVIQRIKQEEQIFEMMKQDLLSDPKYKGNYIAMFEGRIIAFDQNERDLLKKIYQKHGYVPVYVQKVEDMKVEEIPSPFL